MNQPSMRLLVLLASLPGLAACGGGDAAEAARGYQRQMLPVIGQNRVLNEQFLKMTPMIKSEELSGDDIAEKWEQSILPGAADLQATIEIIESGVPELDEVHQQLVFSWTERTAAYQEIVDAYNANDPVAFQKGFSRNLNSKLTEEQYFLQVNAILQVYNLSLSPF